jgi:GTP pyrophosphokinase
LGDRLRQGNATDEDLRLLDSYRRSFGFAYEDVVRVIRDDLGLQPTGRPAKSTTSIIEKLQRESIRLSQMQDIAGCRVVIADVPRQQGVIQHLLERFPQPTVIDRRERPSHGYRAVHVIVLKVGKLVEIQVRTELQHLWAEFSEKWSDVVDPSIKYGGGNEGVRSVLSKTSEVIAQLEWTEQEVHRRMAGGVALEAPTGLQRAAEILEAQEALASLKRGLADLMEKATSLVERVR